MYLTAQRVRARDGAEGVNVFLHRHGAEPIPDFDWSRPDLPRIADFHPGEPVAQSTGRPPGGNTVRSYLDVVCAEGTPRHELDRALSEFEAELTRIDPLEPRQYGPVAVRLGLELGLAGQAGEELRRLREAALLVLDAPASHPVDSPGPLRVMVSPEGQRSVYRLEERSGTRIRRYLGHDHSFPELTVSRDLNEDVPPVNLHIHVAPMLTGLSLEQILLLGGIRFERADTNELLWAWPTTGASATGYCLMCHQHNTLSEDHGVHACAFCGHEQADDGLWVATLT